MQSALFQKKYIYAPITVLTLFNVVTLLFFVLGPLEWRLDNEFLVVIYILLNLTTLNLGYRWGILSYRRIQTQFTFENNKKLIYFFVIFTFFWLLPMTFLRMGVEDFSLTGLFDKIVAGYNDPLSVYMDKLDGFEDAAGQKTPRLQLLDAAFSPIIYGFHAFAILFYNKFGRKVKIGIVVVFVVEALSWIGIGTNKGLTDLALFLFFVALAKNPKLYNFNIKYTVLIGLALTIILGFFINNMLSRFGVQENQSLLETLDFNVLRNPLKETGIYEDMNIGIKFALMQITSYLSQGYYTIGVAFNEPFTWSYGLGNSWSGIALWNKFTGYDLLPDTYIGQLQKNHNISSTVAWHSAYLWFASDLTFFGVPVATFFIGKGLAISWLDTIYKRSLFGVVALCLLSQMVFYFFANNQIISFSLLPFITFISLWLWRRSFRVSL